VVDSHELNHTVPGGHGHDGHGHGGHALPEMPLDPANQSLADALRMSFRILKFVMVALVIVFLFSGITIVDQRQVAVLSRFGRLLERPLGPGLHMAMPFPIDERVDVDTSLRSLTVDAFWMRLSERDRTRRLSELTARGAGLNPAHDGALLTGDHGIMHLLLNVEYSINDRVRVRADHADPADQISDVILFVRNVRDDRELLRSIIKDAAVAEAARTTTDVIWKDPRQIAQAVRDRAQNVLDGMETGIFLEKVAAEQSYFPLQAQREFLSVSAAENHRRELIKEAESYRIERLVNVAGPAWEELDTLIERLDQLEDPTEYDEVIAEIGTILETQATGEAGAMIRRAQQQREDILAQMHADVARFNAYLPEHQRNSQLVRERLRLQMLGDLLDAPGLVKWWMPPGPKRLILSLNRDPEEILQAERDRMRQRTVGP
jgi:modulator of FtsH protease HflK